MNRTIHYQISEAEAGLRVEQYLKRKGYSSQNLAKIKHMPESTLIDGVPSRMRDHLSSGSPSLSYCI